MKVYIDVREITGEPIEFHECVSLTEAKKLIGDYLRIDAIVEMGKYESALIRRDSQ